MGSKKQFSYIPIYTHFGIQLPVILTSATIPMLMNQKGTRKWLKNEGYTKCMIMTGFRSSFSFSNKVTFPSVFSCFIRQLDQMIIVGLFQQARKIIVVHHNTSHTCSSFYLFSFLLAFKNYFSFLLCNFDGFMFLIICNYINS